MCKYVCHAKVNPTNSIFFNSRVVGKRLYQNKQRGDCPFAEQSPFKFRRIEGVIIFRNK